MSPAYRPLAADDDLDLLVPALAVHHNRWCAMIEEL